MLRKFIPVAACLVAVLCTGTLSAQNSADTLRYSAAEAEALFLQNNLPLLAEKLNIGQAEARMLQARAWPNPTFTIDEIQVYKNATTEQVPPLAGNFWRDRNFAMQVEQLILTAGKRKKNIRLELRSKERAEIAFTDLLQALKAEFRQTVSEIIYLQNVQSSWQIQLQEVNRLLSAQEAQLRGGYISQADLFRLKALQIALKSEITSLSEEMSEKQRGLKTLMLADPASYIQIAEPPDTAWIAKLKATNLEELIRLAGNNARLQAAGNQVSVSEAQLDIERANSVPDIRLMANYDRAGSTMLNFIGVGAAVGLPLFNRNKGNIRAARYEVEKSALLQKNTESELHNTIVKYWSDLKQSISLYETFDKDYIEKLGQMTLAIGRNFAEHNISLLQFLDYYESFRESKERYYNVLKNIGMKREELNYLIGGEI